MRIILLLLLVVPDAIVSPYLTINGLFNADGTACTEEQIQ